MNDLFEGAHPEIVRVIDVETTGLDDDDRVVEIAWLDVEVTGPDRTAALRGDPASAFVNPGKPIPPQACAIHHITDGMVRDAQPLDYTLARLGATPRACAAHNAGFDRRYVHLAGDWICTYRAALVAWPDAPHHSNQVLRYWLDLDLPTEKCEPVHRAGPDTFVTAHILARLLASFSIEELVRISARPALLPRCTFGKHAGETWDGVPSGYLWWMLGQADMGEDRHHTARHHLQLRGER